MKVGYARVSSVGQNLESQIRILEEHGCEKIFHQLIGRGGGSRWLVRAVAEYGRVWSRGALGKCVWLDFRLGNS